jgi:Na+/proline symporter
MDSNFSLLIPYAAFLVVLGYLASRGKGFNWYLIADRKVGPLGLGCSIAAGFFDGFILVTYTGFVYKYGWPAISLFIGIVLGFILFSFFTARLQREARDNGYFGMSDYFERHYGKPAAKLVSFYNVIFYVSLLLIQFILGATILQGLSGLSYITCIFIIAFFLLSYTVTGGFRASITTDIFQWVLILFILVFLLPKLVSADNARIVLQHSDLSKSAADVVGFLVIGSMGIFSAPELWQRCFAAKDTRAVRGGLLVAGTTLPLIGVILAGIGFAAYAHFPGLNPEDALVKVFQTLLPKACLGFGMLLLLSAILSTADTALFVIAPTVVLNILQIRSEQTTRRISAGCVVASITLAALAGWLFKDVLKVAFALAGMSVGLFPILLGGLLWPLHPKVVFWSLVLGLVSVILVTILAKAEPSISVVSLPVVLLTLLIGSLWARFKSRKLTL